MLIDEMDGEAHDVEVRALHPRTGYIPDPFLDAIGTGFVEGPVFLYVIVNLFVGEFCEGDIGAIDYRR